MKHRHKTHTAGYNTRILLSNTSSILLKSPSILSQLRGSSARRSLSGRLQTVKSCVLASFLLILAACARMAAPGGGPEDETPPFIVSIEPLPGPGYPDLKKIIIEWSERLDAGSVAAYLYPQMSYNLEIHGSRIEIELDSVPGDVPLVIHLPPEIQDRRGNRSGIPVNLAYSRADSLPTGLIHLSMIRQGGGNIARRTLIELYRILSDSTGDSLLVRRTVADSMGTADVQWLERGYYGILCYEDPDQSFEWNSEQEAGFDTLVYLEKGEILNIEALLTVVDTVGPIITEVEALDRYHLQISFNEEVSFASFSEGQVILQDTSRSNIDLNGFWLQSGFSGEIVTIETEAIPAGEITVYTSGILDLMMNPSEPDSMIFFGIDSLPADSLRLRSYYPAPGNENVNPAGPYTLSFNFWVDIDSLKNKLTLNKVSDSTLIQGSLNGIDGRSFEFIPDHQLIGEQQYRFTLLPGISTAWGDTLLSSFSWSFSTAWGDEPGSIEGNISGTSVQTLLIQISRTGGSSDESVIYSFLQPGQYRVDEIPAGRYTVAAFIDTDGSGTWSSMEPYGTYPGVVLVQPGLITEEINIEILP